MTPELRTAAEILHHFSGAGRLTGEVRGSLVIFRDTFPLYDYWLLTDNGGEVNVERVNCPETMRSVPMTAWREQLDAATIAYRIACVMQDTPIDYDLRMGAEEVAFLQTVEG